MFEPLQIESHIAMAIGFSVEKRCLPHIFLILHGGTFQLLNKKLNYL